MCGYPGGVFFFDTRLADCSKEILMAGRYNLWTNVFSEIYLKVLSIDGASRILDGIKDEVHIDEVIFALSFGIK